MPTWMRQYHLKKINQFLREQSEQEQQSRQKQQDPTTKKTMGPNVKPSSTYNFKK